MHDLDYIVELNKKAEEDFEAQRLDCVKLQEVLRKAADTAFEQQNYEEAARLFRLLADQVVKARENGYD